MRIGLPPDSSPGVHEAAPRLNTTKTQAQVVYPGRHAFSKPGAHPKRAGFAPERNARRPRPGGQPDRLQVDVLAGLECVYRRRGRCSRAALTPQSAVNSPWPGTRKGEDPAVHGEVPSPAGCLPVTGIRIVAAHQRSWPVVDRCQGLEQHDCLDGNNPAPIQPARAFRF